MLIDAARLLRKLEEKRVNLATATLERPLLPEKYFTACGEYKAILDLEVLIKEATKETDQ